MQAVVAGLHEAHWLNRDEEGVAERLALFTFSLSFLLSSTVEALLIIYLRERRVLIKESSRGSFMIANTMASVPFLFVVSLLFSIPVYWIVVLNPSIQAFSFFGLCVWLIILIASSLMLFLSAVSPDFISGNSLICTVLGAFNLFSGYFIPKEKIPKPWMFMKMKRYNSLMILLILGQFFTQHGVSSIRVYTIYSPDGDVIDCINRADQPAFDHPLLRNHVIQEYPTGMPQTGKQVQNWQVWHDTGEECPAGTIPVRRELHPNVSHNKYHPTAPKVHEVANRATTGHKYAIGYMINRQKIYGTRATLNVWAPVVESSNDFSLAQIWVASGSYLTGDLNTIEAGWQVFRSRYNDSQPRFFTFWTADAYNLLSCYGIDCPGFVQTSSTVAIGAAISGTSIYGGTQLDITLQIWKDQISGHWWLGLGLNTEPVGYWPAAIFTRLSDHATTVEWGGEVRYANLSGPNTLVQMGSGELADKGFRRTAYFCNLEVAEKNHSLLPVQDFGVLEDYPRYFTVKKLYNKECGNHFYYGGTGPHPQPQLSGAIRFDSVFSVIHFSFTCLVFLFFNLSVFRV